MPEPARPCGEVAPASARAGGREVRACLKMHKEPPAAPEGARLGAEPLRPASAVWLASREAAVRWREGGRGAAHAGERRGPERSRARRREGWRLGKKGAGAEQCTLEGGRPLAGSADRRPHGGRQEKERKIETIHV